jgi:hypothetical protein
LTDLTTIPAAHAIMLALDACAVSSTVYAAVVRESRYPFVELRLVRYIGNAERVQSLEVSRMRTDEAFADVCCRAWDFLKAEHERKPKTGEQ